MVNTIALEASSAACSVTLRGPNVNATVVVDEARSHSKHFLPVIHSLLGENQMALADLDFIACGNGPGSFTGLRICFGIAQGLAFGLNIPLLTVSSLESMAFAFYQKTGLKDLKTFCVLDAHMSEVYVARFSWRNASVEIETDAQILSIADAEEILTELNKANDSKLGLVGTGMKLLNLSDRRENILIIEDQLEPISTAVADIALQQWASGRAPKAEDAEICYLRNSVSWDKRKRIRSNN